MCTFFKIVFPCIIYSAYCQVLLWSNNNLELSPLKKFTDCDFKTLIATLDSPKITIYKSIPSLLPEFETILAGYKTAYNPNGDINAENATEILDREDLFNLESKYRTDLAKGTNLLSVLVIQNSRWKRDIPSTVPTENITQKGPISYTGKSIKNIYSILYSSQPLIYKTQNSSIEFGASVLVTIDHKMGKNASLRLDVTFSISPEKYILQFIFTWQNAYWSLSMVKIKGTQINSTVNLTITEPFFVPKRFSYHCSGVTVFTDPEKTVELQIFDMQVQPDSTDGDFDDAYDCVDFTTATIWSGLFVTSLLGIALVIALIAISEIKTMDKFDSHKNKQLAITVTE